MLQCNMCAISLIEFSSIWVNQNVVFHWSWVQWKPPPKYSVRLWGFYSLFKYEKMENFYFFLPFHTPSILYCYVEGRERAREGWGIFNQKTKIKLLRMIVSLFSCKQQTESCLEFQVKDFTEVFFLLPWRCFQLTKELNMGRHSFHEFLLC